MNHLNWLIICCFCILGCSGGQGEPQEFVVGKPYALREWPDSSYVANLDSVADAEYVNPYAQKAPEVSMSPSIMPYKAMPRASAGGTATSKPAMQISKEVPSQESKQAEAFAERFQKAMDRLQAEPENANFFLKVTVQDGEDLPALLTRIYGQESKRLPLSIVQSQLSAVNGESLKSIRAGQMIHLPKL
jgi:hypothetical protein